MSQIETRLGLSNILKRLAYHYVLKGVGVYPISNPQYDKVEVKELYGWRANPEVELEMPAEYGAGLVVNFFKNNRRVRYVEFGVRYVGGGGDEAIKLLK